MKFVVACTTAVVFTIGSAFAQYAGPNVNVGAAVQAGSLPEFLQRQNEPAVAASSRNPDYILAVFNDYSTVSLPGDPSIEPDQEAWLGYGISPDHGKTWVHGLVPGYPQDTSAVGTASPMFGQQAGSDPVVAAGPNGRFYVGGLFFIRGGTSNIIVMRYVHRNNTEIGTAVTYETAVKVDGGAASPNGAFTDKPSLVADPPRQTTDPGACGNVYISYSIFDGVQSNGNFRSKVMFSRSTDCGNTWSKPIKLNGTNLTNQGTAMAVDANTGAIYVVWRSFAPDMMLWVKSTDQGLDFTSPAQVDPSSPMAAFDQPTLPSVNQPSASPTFRSNGFPTAAVDNNGTLYVAWQERAQAFLAAGATDNSPRIVLTSMPVGGNWTPRTVVEYASPTAFQLMPSLSYAGGKLNLFFYDFRGDDPLDPLTGWISGWWMVNRNANVRWAQATPPLSGNPVFSPSVQVSQYAAAGNNANYTMYQGGTVPFMGDYIQVATTQAIAKSDAGASSVWRAASRPSDLTAQNSYSMWTDNRDVVLPAGNPPDFTLYDPPGSGAPSCNPGSRNANVYFSGLSISGYIAGTPTSYKQLFDSNQQPIQRTFIVYVENHTAVTKTVTLTINAPSDVQATFNQFIDPINGPVTQLDFPIYPGSSTARTLYVTPKSASLTSGGTVRVDVSEKGGSLIDHVFFNLDPTNPPVLLSANAEVHNVTLSTPTVTVSPVNPLITYVTWTATSNANTVSAYTALVDIRNVNQLINAGYTFTLSTQKAYATPSLSGCNLASSSQAVAVGNVLNPQVSNPQVSNPQVSNPQVSNPQVSNPQVSNATFFMAPSDSSSGGFAATTSSSSTDTGLTRQPDVVTITLTIVAAKTTGTKWDPKQNQVTLTVYAQAVDTANLATNDPNAADHTSSSTQ